MYGVFIISPMSLPVSSKGRPKGQERGIYDLNLLISQMIRLITTLIMIIVVIGK